jgi:hypothetical protein
MVLQDGIRRIQLVLSSLKKVISKLKRRIGPAGIAMLLAAPLFAQSTINLATQGRNADFSSFPSTRTVTVGNNIPATCIIGQLFFNSTSAAGSNLYGCTAPNSWIQLGGNINLYTFAAPLSLSGQTVSLPRATSTADGYLFRTDWSTFNSKQPAGNYLTGLNGDITANGPGTVAATLATVNTAPGQCGDATHVCQITVNGKGLVTGQSGISLAGGSGNATSIVGIGVSATPPSNLQVLQYQSGSNTYVPATVATGNSGNAVSIQGVSVSTTAPANNQGLFYNAVSGRYEPSGNPACTQVSSQLTDFVPSFSATGGGTISFNTSASTGTPSIVQVGSNFYRATSGASAFVSGTGNDLAYVYVDTSGNLDIGTSAAAVTCTGCTYVPGISAFPVGSKPLFTWAITSGAFASSTGYTDYRSFLSAGPGLIIDRPLFRTAICQGSTASSALSLGSSNAPTPVCFSGTNTNYAALQFSAANQKVQDRFKLPPTWTGAIDLDLIYNSVATTGAVAWNVATACVADGATGDPAFNAAQIVSSPTQSASLQWKTLSLTGVTTSGCAPNSELLFKVALDASTTATGNINLQDLRFTIRRTQ